MEIYNLTLVDNCTKMGCWLTQVNNLTGQWLVIGFTALLYLILFIGSIQESKRNFGSADVGSALIFSSTILFFISLLLLAFDFLSWYIVIAYVFLGVLGYILKADRDYNN